MTRLAASLGSALPNSSRPWLLARTPTSRRSRYKVTVPGSLVLGEMLRATSSSTRAACPGITPTFVRPPCHAPHPSPWGP